MNSQNISGGHIFQEILNLAKDTLKEVKHHQELINQMQRREQSQRKTVLIQISH